MLLNKLYFHSLGSMFCSFTTVYQQTCHMCQILTFTPKQAFFSFPMNLNNTPHPSIVPGVPTSSHTLDRLGLNAGGHLCRCPSCPQAGCLCVVTRVRAANAAAKGSGCSHMHV